MNYRLLQNRDEINCAGKHFDYGFGYRFSRLFIVPVIFIGPFCLILIPMAIDYIKWKYFGYKHLTYDLPQLELSTKLILLAQAFGWLMIIGLAVRYVVCHSAISITSEGITQYIWGIPKRFTLWREIIKIIKVRKYHPSRHFYYNEVVVLSNKGSISFRDYIENYDVLLNIINSWIRQHNTPTEFIDRGPDSRRRLASAAERRYAQKFGIKSTIIQL